MDKDSRRVLAIGAHPDDVEFLCAGTLLLLADAGVELHVATMTSGDCGSSELGPSEISAIRKREAIRACQILGAEYHCLEMTDFGVFVDNLTTRRVAALIREVDPWLVVTHSPVDYMADHEHTSTLVRNGCFIAPVPNYDTEAFTSVRRSTRVAFLYYAQPVENRDNFGRRVSPQMLVDITDQIDRKAALLACHESQRNWLRTHHSVDEYIDSMRRWSQELGAEATEISGREVTFAEGFRQHLGHAYPSSNALTELLPEGRIINAAR